MIAKTTIALVIGVFGDHAERTETGTDLTTAVEVTIMIVRTAAERVRREVLDGAQAVGMSGTAGGGIAAGALIAEAAVAGAEEELVTAGAGKLPSLWREVTAPSRWSEYDRDVGSLAYHALQCS